MVSAILNEIWYTQLTVKRRLFRLGKKIILKFDHNIFNSVRTVVRNKVLF